MRVLIFTNMITPYTNRLYNGLAQVFDLALLTCCEQESNRSWAQTFALSYSHRVLPGWTIQLSPHQFAHLNRGVFSALNRSRPDVLVVSGFYPSMVTAVTWAQLTTTPVALSVDGGRNDMPTSLYHGIVRPWITRRCRSIGICGNNGVDFFLKEGVPADRLFVIPLVPAWDTPANIPGFAERPYHLLWVGHMNEEVKNLSFFIDVAIALKGRIPNLRVRLVGSGPALDPALDRFRKSEVCFDHAPAVPWHEMANVYISARCLALPSVFDAWGLACNEAMQCGVPCVVSPFVGASDDLVISNRNGYVCPLTVEEWTKRIESLVTDQVVWNAYSRNSIEDATSRTVGSAVTAFQAMVDRAMK